MSDYRQLMKDGAWIVPVEDRPKGWERYGVAEQSVPAIPATVDTSSSLVPEPTPLLDAVVQHGIMANSETKAPVVKDRRRTGKNPLVRGGRFLSQFRELDRAIQQSATIVGADAALIDAGRVLVAGMWTREWDMLSTLLNISVVNVALYGSRFTLAGIWSPDGVVIFGGAEDLDCADLGFWLCAMVGTGDIDGKWDGTQMMYTSAA